MKKKPYAMLLVTGFWALVLVQLLSSAPVEHYVQTVKHQATKVDRVVTREEELRNMIEGWRSTMEIKPINASYDESWKAAVPGYNGRSIDMEASIIQMKMTGKTTQDQLIFKEVEPDVSLEEVGVYPIYRGNPEKPAISFMINVAWGNEYLDSILKTLEANQIKTTFFLDGSWVRRNPELAKKIASYGHEIGNHAYSHPDMKYMSDYQIRQEIGKTQQIIEKTLGIKPNLFAPPSGSFSSQVVKIAKNDFQMKTIMWSADTIDWMKPSPDVVIRRIDAKMGKGVMVLMHPTAATAQSLPALIKMAKQRGLTPTTVSEVISSKRIDTP